VSEGASRLHAAIAEEHQRLVLRLNDARGPLTRLASELRAQLARLVYSGFFSATPWNRLADLPRYLRAMQLRLDKFGANPERDAKHAASIAQLWGRYEERLAKQKKAGAIDPRLEEFRWHLEELRVSLFAQELKTPYPVSFKRLDKLWNAMR
jgi:ATP-dependent helicase HrpA